MQYRPAIYGMVLIKWRMSLIGMQMVEYHTPMHKTTNLEHPLDMEHKMVPVVEPIEVKVELDDENIPEYFAMFVCRNQESPAEESDSKDQIQNEVGINKMQRSN